MRRRHQWRIKNSFSGVDMSINLLTGTLLTARIIVNVINNDKSLFFLLLFTI